MCKVIPAACENAWNHSLNNSVSISPNFTTYKSTYQSNYGLYETSKATLVKVSSIGIIA